MSGLAAATVAVLQCAAPAGGLLTQPLTVRIKSEAAVLESLRMRQPPMPKAKMQGESARTPEWQFTEATAGLYNGMTIVRVVPGPTGGPDFLMRFGAIEPDGRKTYRYTELARGTCQLTETTP